MNQAIRASFLCASAACLLALAGCASSHAPRQRLAADVDGACGGTEWRSQRALQADLTIRRAGKPDLIGVMFYDIRQDRMLLQFAASGGGQESLGLDGSRLWMDGPGQWEGGQWLTLLQWAAWVGVPYRLTEPSLRVREVQPISVAGVKYRVAQVERPTDGPGSCALYVGQQDLLPHGVVPVYSAGPASSDAPTLFACEYEEFSSLDGVIVPKRWSVWRWDAKRGVSEAGPFASVTLERPRFVTPDPAIFEAPRDDSLRAASDQRIPVRPTEPEVSRAAP